MTSRPRLHVLADRRAAEIRRAIGSDLRGNRVDQGVSQQRVADAAGVDRGHVARIEAGTATASLEAMERVATALGGDLSLRYYPGTGTALRDRHQAAVVEAILRSLAPAWRASLEVPVYRPARGVIDAVLARSDDGSIVAVEVYSQVRRLEQLLRWGNLKRESLPSSDWWRVLGLGEHDGQRVSALLVVRVTAANRRAVAEHAATVATAFPCATAAAHRSLVAGGPWPGHSLIWAEVGGGGAILRTAPPPEIPVGR